MQKVYVSDEEKEKIVEKLNRDIEVRKEAWRNALHHGFLSCVCVRVSSFVQFLVRMRIMDYSLLLGIHDVKRAEREVEEEIEPFLEEENGLTPTPVSTSPEGIAGNINSFKPTSPGEFDPYVDVYAIQSAVGECWQ